jgi:hypothetical protein
MSFFDEIPGLRLLALVDGSANVAVDMGTSIS